MMICFSPHHTPCEWLNFCMCWCCWWKYYTWKCYCSLEWYVTSITRINEHAFIYLVVGIPDPPTNVGYDESVVIESSVDLEWSRPSYTGSRGVSVMTYTVSANGGTVVVSDDSEVVRYTSQSLIYGDVLVSAINSCGQQSIPALHNIPTSGVTVLLWFDSY